VKKRVSRPAPPPKRQAIDIQQLLIWTYRTHCADRVELGGSPVPSSDGWVPSQAAYDALDIGADIDTSVGFIEVEPDARTVHHALTGLVVSGELHESVRRLVIEQAYKGEEPTLAEHVNDYFLPVWVEANGGRRTAQPKVEWTDKKCRYGYCPLDKREGSMFRDHARRVYGLWHHALSLLAGRLRGEGVLERWLVHGPAAVAEPWGTPQVVVDLG